MSRQGSGDRADETPAIYLPLGVTLCGCSCAHVRGISEIPTSIVSNESAAGHIVSGHSGTGLVARSRRRSHRAFRCAATEDEPRVCGPVAPLSLPRDARIDLAGLFQGDKLVVREHGRAWPSD